MSNETKALSISFRSDDGCIEHNNRDFFTDNVDKSRTPNNITYVKRDLRELYHELFDEALVEYNARQNRFRQQLLIVQSDEKSSFTNKQSVIMAKLTAQSYDNNSAVLS